MGEGPREVPGYVSGVGLVQGRLLTGRMEGRGGVGLVCTPGCRCGRGYEKLLEQQQDWVGRGSKKSHS